MRTVILAEAVDSADVRVSKCCGFISFSVEVKRPNESSDCDNDLFSVIPGGGPCSLTISLASPSTALVHCGGFDLLKCLRERFQDKIRISAEISSTSSPDPEGYSGDLKLCIPSKKGMAIINAHGDITRYYCEASVPFIEHFISLNLAESSFQVKITAHISDDDDNDDDLSIAGVSDSARYLSKEMIRKILEDGAPSDAIIVAGNGAEIKSYKSFLMATSSVLKRMFESEMEESKTGRIDMTDISEEGVRAFLRFIYYGDVIGLKETLDIAYDLLYVAHKYDVPELEAFMRSYMMIKKDDDFSPEMAFKIYSFVRGIETASEIAAKMIRIMGMNFDELKKVPEFKDIFQKNLEDALEICGIVVKSLKRKVDEEQNEAGKKPRQPETPPRPPVTSYQRTLSPFLVRTRRAHVVDIETSEEEPEEILMFDD